MSFKKDTITTTTYTINVTELLDKEQQEELADRYFIDEKEMQELKLTITVEPTAFSGEQVIDFWCGLQDYGNRFYLFGIPKDYFPENNLDGYIKEVVPDFIDWEELFDSMVR